MRHNEMLPTTLALLLTAPEGEEVSYTFAGETTVDGADCNVLDVEFTRLEIQTLSRQNDQFAENDFLFRRADECYEIRTNRHRSDGAAEQGCKSFCS